MTHFDHTWAREFFMGRFDFKTAYGGPCQLPWGRGRLLNKTFQGGGNSFFGLKI